MHLEPTLTHNRLGFGVNSQILTMLYSQELISLGRDQLQKGFFMLHRSFVSFVFLILLCACGPVSNTTESSSVTDTLTSSSRIQFESDGKTISFLSVGADQSSKVPGLEICAFTPLSGDSASSKTLSYLLVDTNNLKLDQKNYSYKRALIPPKTKSGVPDRVFAVWTGTPQTVSGVTLTFELEIEPELLTFRLNCST